MLMSNFSEQAAQLVAPTLATKTAYGVSTAGIFVAGLTINEFVGVAVGVTSIISMVWTAAYNMRHKKKVIELLEAQIANERKHGD